MSMNINIAKVESVYDDSDGLRIKARIIHDKKKEVMYAFPLLPKTLQTIPKVGEAVLIIYSQNGNVNSQRFYIGPVISQPQFMEKAEYNLTGYSPATTTLNDSIFEPLPKISNFAVTDGAFPDKEDVALVGRHSEDIILKNNEINLRCGIRNKAVSNDDIAQGLYGDVIFNSNNPAYIQMKYRRQKGGESVINLVGDKINLISYQNNPDIQDKYVHGSTDSKDENEHLIKESEMDEIIEKLHPLPYGDKLVTILEEIRRAIQTHIHPFPGLPPITTELSPMLTDYKEILTPYVRVS